MSDEFGQKKVEQAWEPGTLDATRRAIGPIDREEAVRMTKLLGGEILQEKSAPIDYSAFPKKERHYSHRANGRSAADVASLSANNSLTKNSNSSSEQKKGDKYGYVPKNGPKKRRERTSRNCFKRSQLNG